MAGKRGGISFDLIDYIKEITDKLVTKAEFEPVKAIVFAMVGIMAISILGALLKLILK